MKKNYYGIAAIAAIGGGLWWYLRKPSPEPACLDDGDCPIGYFCQGGVCIPESTGAVFVVDSLSCDWYNGAVSLTGVVSNVGTEGGYYTSIITGSDGWRDLDEPTEYIEAGSSATFVWLFSASPGEKTDCLEDKCCTYVS